MFPTLLEFDGKPISSWLVMALIGAWVAWFDFRAAMVGRARVPAWQIGLFAIGAVPIWFIGAHLAQVLTVGTPLASNLRELFSGGYVLYGGMVALLIYGFVAWHVLAWRRKLLLQELGDVGAQSLLWLMVLGRIGCILYGCCHGSPAGAWPGYELNFERWDHATRHFPAHLADVKLHAAVVYEVIGMLGIVFLLAWARKREAAKPGTFPPGVTGWMVWISYGVIRFLTEFLRGDPRGAPLGGFSPSQWISLLTIAVGATLMRRDWKLRRKPLLKGAGT